MIKQAIRSKDTLRVLRNTSDTNTSDTNASDTTIMMLINKIS